MKEVKFQFTSEGKDQVKSDFKEVDKSLDDLKNSGKDAQDSLGKFPDTLGDLKDGFDELGGSLGDAGGNLDDFAEVGGKASGSIASMAGGLLLSGGLIAGVSLLVEFAPDIINFFDEMVNGADTSTEKVKVLSKELNSLVEFQGEQKFKIVIPTEDLEKLIADSKKELEGLEATLDAVNPKLESLDGLGVATFIGMRQATSLAREDLEKQIGTTEAYLQLLEDERASNEARAELKAKYSQYVVNEEEKEKNKIKEKNNELTKTVKILEDLEAFSIDERVIQQTEALNQLLENLTFSHSIGKIDSSTFETDVNTILDLINELNEGLISIDEANNIFNNIVGKNYPKEGKAPKQKKDKVIEEKANEVVGTISNVFASEGKNIWEDFFGEANSIGEKVFSALFSNLLDNISTSLFTDLLSFLPGGSLLGGLGSIFGLGKVADGGSAGGVKTQNVLVQIGENQVEKATYRTVESAIGDLQRRRVL